MALIGIIYPKMKILSIFNNPIPNPSDLFFLWNTKGEMLQAEKNSYFIVIHEKRTGNLYLCSCKPFFSHLVSESFLSCAVWALQGKALINKSYWNMKVWHPNVDVWTSTEQYLRLFALIVFFFFLLNTLYIYHHYTLCCKEFTLPHR